MERGFSTAARLTMVVLGVAAVAGAQWLAGRGRPAPVLGPSVAPAAGAATGASDEPPAAPAAPPTPTEAPPPPRADAPAAAAAGELPSLAWDESGAGRVLPTLGAALAQTAATPERANDAVVRCRVADVSLPQQAELLQARMTDTMPTLATVPRLLRAKAPRWHDAWLLVTCTGDNEPHRVQLYFQADVAAALIHVQAHGELVLQLLGTAGAGGWVAQFVRWRGPARPPSGGDPGLPDLVAMLALPSVTPAGPITCEATTPVSWPERAWLSAETLALVAPPAPRSEEPASPLTATRCRDRHGREVPALVAWPAALALDALRVAPGTRIRVQPLGIRQSRLVLRAGALEAGGRPVADDDLRQGLIDEAWIRGREFTCRSKGLPLPLQEAPDALPARLPDTGALALRRTWIVCAPAGAGPAVHLDLFFRANDSADLLAIGPGSLLRLRGLGRRGGRLLGLFEQVIERPLPAAGRATDLRRLVQLDSSLRGSLYHCHPIGAAGETTAIPAGVSALFRGPAPRGPVTIRCGDPLRPVHGQEVLVYFADAASETRWHDLLAGSQPLAMLHAGVAENLPVALATSAALDAPRPTSRGAAAAAR